MSPDEEARESYRLAVEMADRVSARRGQANQFYLAVETLLLGVPAAVNLVSTAHDSRGSWTTLLLALVGLAVSAAWWLQLRSYRDLNRAKFAVINQIEADYFTIRPFSEEWVHLNGDSIKPWRKRYAELGTVERVLPVVFGALHIALAIGVVLCS